MKMGLLCLTHPTCVLREEDKEIETLIKKVTSTARRLGAEWFIKRLEKMLDRDILPKKAVRPKGKMKK